jgi:hypothetical protein
VGFLGGTLSPLRRVEVFGGTSSGTEQDAGVQYPTLIQDTNGDQVTITYQAGLSVPWGNSSSRIASVHDVMGTYFFAYTADWVPHLSTINSSYPAENYSFGYSTNANLLSPFSGPQFGSAQMLQTVTNTNSQMTTTFSYGVNNSGELSQATFPYGGHLRWAYTNMIYTGSRTQREVQNRYLAMSSGAGELTYPIAHDPTDSGRSFHNWTLVDDAGGQGEKVWLFQTDNTQAGFGLQWLFSERLLNPYVEKRYTYSAWTLDPLNRPYIPSTQTAWIRTWPSTARTKCWTSTATC